MFRFKVFQDGHPPVEVRATSRDVAMWERTNKGASLHLLQSELKMSDLYKVAYNACQREGVFAGSLKEFENDVDLDVLDDEDVDPTRSAA